MPAGTGKLPLLAATLLAAVIYLFGTTGPATASWQTDVGSIRLGIITGNQTQLAIRRIEPFRRALAEELQIKVEIFTAPDYETLIEAQIGGLVNYAHYSAAAFATAWLRCKCLEPVAVARMADGVMAFRSILLARQDVASSLDDLHGKLIGVPGKGSLTGYLLPMGELHGRGIDLVDSPSGENQAKLVITGSAENNLRQFLSGQVDAMFGWSTMSGMILSGYSAGTLTLLVKEHGQSTADYRVLWKSSPIPFGPHAVSKQLPEPAKVAIREFLVELYNNRPAAYDAVEHFNSGGFSEIGHAPYQSLIDLFSSKKNHPLPDDPPNDGKPVETGQ